MESSRLRFRHTKADGSVDYTVYGFHREPLMQFTLPAGSAPLAKTTSTKVTSLAARPIRDEASYMTKISAARVCKWWLLSRR